MILWLIFAAMTATAMLAVLLPLRRRAPARSGSDVAVYRDQLEEIDRDRAAGLVGAGEAEAARVEISRRLIAAAAPVDAGRADAPVEARWGRRAAALAGVVMLPLGSAGLYLALGSPGIPSEPLASRSVASPAPMSIEAMIVQVEAHLARNPDDGRGWEVLAPIYLRAGRFDDAVKARRNALRLLGPTAVREADLGQAMVAAADGVVTADARAAFERRHGALLPWPRGRAGRQARGGGGDLAQAPGRSAAGGALDRHCPGRARPDWRGGRARCRSANASRRPGRVAEAARGTAGRDDPRHGRAPGRAAQGRRLRPRRLGPAGALLSCARRR